MPQTLSGQRSIKASTRIGGLIGRGISHSLSPFIHNTSAALLGLDAVYELFDTDKAPDAQFFERYREANCYGFNVTVPYKERVAELFPLKGLASVNTLVNRGQDWGAFSTDAEGFLQGLRDLDCELSDFEAVICLGHGGAAKALIHHFRYTSPQLPLFALKRHGGDGDFTKDFTPEVLKELILEYPYSLVIQCTSAPLHGDDLSRFSISIQNLKGAFVDLVYGRPSAILSYAQQNRIRSQDGLPMLLGQALLSQKLWWGQSADFSAMKAALRAHLT